MLLTGTGIMFCDSRSTQRSPETDAVKRSNAENAVKRSNAENVINNAVLDLFLWNTT